MPALELRKVVRTSVIAATLERSACQMRRQVKDRAWDTNIMGKGKEEPAKET